MALLERLQILVDADTKGAQREFQQFGATVERQIGKSDDKLKQLSGSLKSFGVTAAAASGVAAIGLFKLADAASNYGEQLNKATKIVGKDSVKDLEKFAESAVDTAGISKTAALEASAGFAALGKQAGLSAGGLTKFATGFTQLAGDLASFNNRSVEDALAAIQSGLQGEAEPLKKFNIFLNDTAIKAEYVALTGEKVTGVLTTQQRIIGAQSLIYKQAADAQNDFSETSDGLANRQRKLKAEFENLKVTVGQSLVPAFEVVFGIVGGVAEGFNDLDPAVQGAVGSIAGIGVVAGGAAGGLSLMAGFAIDSIERFRQLRDAAANVQTPVGKAAVAFGKFAGVAGIIAGVGFALKQLVENAADIGPEIDDIFEAIDRGAANSQPTIEKTLKQFDGIGGLLTDNFQEAKAAFADLDKLTQQSPQATLDYLDQVEVGLKDYVAALVESGDIQSNEATRVELAIQKNINAARDRVKVVESATAKEKEYTGVSGESTDATDANTEATKGAVDAWKAYRDAVNEATNAFEGTLDAQGRLDDAQSKVIEAQNKLAFLTKVGAQNTPEFAEALTELGEAQRGVAEAAFAQEDAQASLYQTLLEKGPSAIDEANAAIDRQVAKGLISIETGNLMKAAYREQAEAALTLGASTDEAARATNRLKEANDNALGSYLRIIASVSAAEAIPAINALGAVAQIGGGGVGWKAGDFGKRASGGPVMAGAGYMVGENGPEFFRPPSNGMIVPNDKMGSGPVVGTQNIYTLDPILAATEAVRRQRDAQYLYGR